MNWKETGRGMWKKKPQQGLTVCVMSCLLFLWGCGTKLPRLQQPSLDRRVEAELLLQRYLERPRIEALDADVRIHWDTIGSSGAADGLLQMQEPGLFRLTIVDPLGRSLFILVSDSRSFTLVDNREGKGYQGRIESQFLQRYIPASIVTGDLFSLLGGLMPLGSNQVDGIGIDKGNNIWYGFRAGAGEHRVLLEGVEPVMKQHLIEDGEQYASAVITYADYFSVDSAGSLWPGLITVTGGGIHGTIRLEVKKVVSVLPGKTANYRIMIPAHYTREIVE